MRTSRAFIICSVLACSVGGSGCSAETEVDLPSEESVAQQADAVVAVASFEAESFSIPPNAGAYSEAGASGGRVLGLWANGWASKTVTLSSAASLVVVRARGTDCQGGARLEVKVDGKAAFSGIVGTSTANYQTSSLTLAAGAHTVELGFTNDYRNGCDRNLILDTVTFGKPDGPAPPPPPAPSAGLPFPRLGLFQYIFTDIQRLGRWDLVVPSFSERAKYPALRSANPKIKILSYVDSNEDNYQENSPDAYASGFNDRWWLKNANGSYPSYPWSSGRKALNVSAACPVVNGKKWADHLAQWVVANYNDADGVMYDLLSNEVVKFLGTNVDLDANGVADGVEHGAAWIDQQWASGGRSLTEQTRRGYGSKPIIVGNDGQGFNATNNGFVRELNWVDRDFITKTYLPWQKSHFGDFYALILVNNGPDGNSQANYKKLRGTLAATLMGDAYFGYSDGNAPTNGGYTALWWYDEYSVDLATGKATGDASRKGYLGQPRGAAQELANGVWRRDYDNGIALVNESNGSQTVSLEKAYRRISGTQAPSVNSGGTTTSVTLTERDGVILLR